METLVMYAQSSDAPSFCLKGDWEKIKAKLHGNVDYALFKIRNKSPLEIGRKIKECQEGSACAFGGGHLCLK